MPDNKKHHYVPRFYLRIFSKDKNSINIYNKEQEKVFLGNINNQCYPKRLGMNAIEMQ
jgi:hypothetical protein